jgi:hypothetical protein
LSTRGHSAVISAPKGMTWVRAKRFSRSHSTYQDDVAKGFTYVCSLVGDEDREGESQRDEEDRD